MPKFKGGVSINDHARNGSKMRHLRIKAGPQRDEYVHSLVCRAKIAGRRESFEREHPGVAIPNNDFYSLIYETVEHDDGDSLNNEPTNLIPMTRAENTRRMMERRFPKEAQREAAAVSV